MAAAQRISVEEWHKKLATNFSTSGLVGGSLTDIDRFERDAGKFVMENFPGQVVLLDSFMGFFLETLDLAEWQVASNGWPKDKPNFAVAFVFFRNIFRSFRACETLFMKGYPLQAFASLRDIKDRAFSIAGIAHGKASFSDVMGAIPLPTTDSSYRKLSLRKRKDTEQLISRRLVKEDSGLSADVQQDLADWDGFFHSEVHGATLSFTKEVGAMLNRKLNVSGPTFDYDSYVMYMNRSAEIGWLIVRLLPFLQLSQGAFWKEWEEKRQILDDSFRYMVEALGILGKRIGASFVTMVEVSFSFPTQFYYSEA